VTIGTLANRLLSLFGCSLIRLDRLRKLRALEHYQPSEDALAEHLRRVFELYQVDCVFDVGANDGWYRNWIREKVGYGGLIVSFEPIPSQVQILERNAIGDNFWVVRACALGRNEESRTFNVMESNVFSSFLKPSPNQPGKYVHSNCLRSCIPVHMSTVAAEWAKILKTHNARRMHLKMDTQGFDIEVFAGAIGVIDSIVTLQSELAFVQLYENGASFRDAIQIFDDAGFKPSALQPISYDEELRLIEADGVFVRNEFQLGARRETNL